MSNKGSLILASDLAVTMEDYKSYVGVKKIFEFKDFPAGIMINGLMDFENIPLETLICEFINKYKDFESIEKLKNLATLSNGQEIANLDLTHEDEMIRKYHRKLSRQKYMSRNYQKTLKKILQRAEPKK